VNTLKPLVTIAVLAGLGFFLYQNINGRSAEDLSGDLAGLWGDVAPGGGGAAPGPAPAFGESATDGPAVSWDTAPASNAMPSIDSSLPLPGTTAVPSNLSSGPPTGVPPQPSAVDEPAAIGPTAVSPSNYGDPVGPTVSTAYDLMGQTPAGTAASTVQTESTPYMALRTAVQISLDRGEYAEPLALLSRWYGDPSLTPTEKADLSGVLGQLAGTVIYSSEHHLEMAHVVQPGETLESVAKTFQVPWQLLAKINGVAPAAALEVGSELKVIRGPFAAVISLSDRELTLMLGSRYAGRFPIGIGQDHQQTEGRWTVQQKQINPTYYGQQQTIDADDPQNPLGEHMLGLTRAGGVGANEVFGIHGTNDPSSIDRDDPRGFIRLAPGAAQDVFDILTIGSNVIIRR
jgi:LysM repeat protein